MHSLKDTHFWLCSSLLNLYAWLKTILSCVNHQFVALSLYNQITQLIFITDIYVYINIRINMCIKSIQTNLSAPAQDNILLILITWKGWSLMRRWKESLPQFFTIYLLQQMRAASSASLDSCSYSSETMWIQSGSSSTRAFFRPKS